MIGAGIRTRVQALARRGDGELLLDLGDVAVAAQAVRPHVLIDLAEHHLGLRLASGAGHSALGVDDEVADEPGTCQGSERQEGRGRVAARRADQRDRRVDEGLELRSVEFREAIDGHVEQVGRGMLEAVPARIVGRVAQAEVGPEVDHGRARSQQVRHEFGGGAVREGQERGVHVRQLGPHGQVRRGEVGMMVAERLVLAVAAGEPDDAHVGMTAQEPDQLAAAVPGRADDPDADATGAAIGRLAASRAGESPRRPVRRDRCG